MKKYILLYLINKDDNHIIISNNIILLPNFKFTPLYEGLKYTIDYFDRFENEKCTKLK